MFLSRSIFASGLIVFVVWYLVAYIVTTGTTAGSLYAVEFAAVAVFAGLVGGLVLSAGTRAIELTLTHRSVRVGESRDGATVSLGRLPVVERDRRDPGEVDGLEVTKLPASGDVSEAGATAEAKAGATADTIEPESVATDLDDSAPDEVGADTDRLIDACSAFAREHADVTIDACADGSNGCVGIIDRTAAPEPFAEFLDVVEKLADSHVDTSRIVVSAGADGVPTEVRFPLG